jgi:uncharacterized protein YndB with AHSA1/START domain
VTLERRYTADQADVWQAITDPDRVNRWFLPLTGDLREGGNFQLEGNAAGDIMTCEPPRHLIVTFGGERSIVDVLLSGDGQQTLLKLTHAVPLELAGSGAGALYVGPGWDGAMLGFNVHSVKEWVAAIEASGTADADAISAAREASLAQFAPDLVRPE